MTSTLLLSAVAQHGADVVCRNSTGRRRAWLKTRAPASRRT